MTRLVRRQLVRFQDRRYFLHPLDREYARGQLPPGGPGDSPAAFTLMGLRSRAAEYYAQIRTPPESWRSLEDVRPQLAEFELRCDTGDYDTAAAVLADIDMDYLLVWGHYRTLAELNQRIYQRITDPFLNGRHRVHLAIVYSRLGSYRQAIDLHTQVLAEVREAGDREHEIGQLFNLANCHSSLGDYRQAIDLHTQAVAIARETGDRQHEASQLGNLANCYSFSGDNQQAISLHTQVLAIARETGDRQHEASELGNLASCHMFLGEYRQAIDLHTRALAIARDTGGRQQESYQLGRLALCHVFLGDYRQATDLQAQMLASARDTADRQYRVGQLGNVATCHVFLGNYRQALDLYTQALAIAREIGAPESAVNSQPGLARAHLQLGDPATALTVLGEQHRPYPGAPEPAIRLIEAMALLELHRTEEAVKAFKDALAAAAARLALADTNVAALQVRVLALGGLAVTTSDPARTAETETALGRAQAIVNAPGAAADTRRLLKLIASHDHSGILAEAASLQDQ